jgi:thiamine-phosphate pyrophosphorylase
MLSRGGFEARAREVLEAGSSEIALHLRGPATDGATLYALAQELLPRARDAGALLIVNDRLDVALALDVHGAHVGHRSLGVGSARALLGDGRLLGASVRDAAEARIAGGEGADFVFLGTIFPTPSHPGYAGMGLEALEAVARSVSGWPSVVAIGGIDPARAAEVLGAGAHGVAVVRGVWDSRDPTEAVQRYRDALASAGTRA